MLGPPLQYQSLKAVLLHMDASTRFRISLNMPSIRSVEKVVPLKIDRLELCDCTTKINRTRYELEIVRYYQDENTSQRTKWEYRLDNRCDFDKFGFPVTGNNVLLPGDISFRKENQIDPRFDTEEDERRCRDDLKVHEKTLKRLNEFKSKGKSLTEEIQRNFDLPSRIKKAKLKLLSFDCRRNNTKSPLTFYIQLTIAYGFHRHIQRFEYNKKLYEAVKYLHQALLGGRTMPIRADNIVMESDGLVCRLPVGFRLLANEVDVRPRIVSHKNFHSLVENSNYLDNVWIRCVLKPNKFRNQVVRNAKKVVIVDSFGQDTQTQNQVLRRLPNLAIYYSSYTVARSGDHLPLIEAWLSRDRPVGASFWIGLSKEDTAREILRLVGIRYEKIEENERCVTVRKNDSSNVEVCCVPFEESMRGSFYRQWIVKFRIVNV